MVQQEIINAWYKSVDFFMSIITMGLIIKYVNVVQSTIIPESPKALYVPQNIYTPPLTGLQVFIFLFNFFVILYWYYHLPCLNGIKRKFEYYRFKIKTKEDDKTSGSIMALIFVITTKALALCLTLYFMAQANSSVNQQVSKFEFKDSNKDAINALKEQITNGNTALAFLVCQFVLLVVDEAKNFIIGS